MATKGKELSELGSILSVSANTANIDGSLIVSNSVTIGNSTVNATFTATSINANTVGGNTASDLRSYSDTVAATAYSNAATYAGTAAGTAYSNAATYADNKAANAYSNAIAYSANATNISSGTLTANVLPTSGVTAATYGNSSQIPVITVDATGRITSATTNAVAGVTSFTYTEANNTFAISTGDGSTFAANIGTANATHTGVLKVLDSVANTNTTIAAAVSSVKTAYDAAIAANTNAASAYSNAVSYAGTIAATAYTNATSYAASIAGTAYSNGVTYTDNKAANAYSNATTFASNASNISSGTLAEPRLPFRMDQNVRTNDSVSFGSVSITGNLTVTGTTVTINTTNLTVDDNMIYLNEGAGGANANPDLGFAGAYNDGTYRHAGFFRDASDGVWKVFDQYLPEPDASPFIDTANTSFRIANFQANVVTAASLSGNGASVTSVDAATVGGNTAGTLRSYSDSVAATAYTNAVSSASSSAATAYSNAVSYFTTNYTASDVLTKIKTVDGTGSGLDADTVDGYDASSFALKTDPEFTNDITTSSGQGRFGGWYQGTGYTGAALEVGVSGGEGQVLAYNRGTSSYLNMNFAATDFEFSGQSSGFAHINTSFRAPIFYDSGNTSFYIDPASSSNIGSLTTNSGYNLQTSSASSVYTQINATDVAANYAYIQLTTQSGSGYLIRNRTTGNSVTDKSLYLYNDSGPIEFVPSANISVRATLSTTGMTIAGSTVWTAANDGAGSGLDADLLDGLNQTTAATASTIVARDSNGHITGNYILGSYFNSSAGNSENPTIGQIWTQSTGDNYLRKSTPAHFISQLSLVTNTSGGITIGNNTASEVDVYYQSSAGYWQVGVNNYYGTSSFFFYKDTGSYRAGLDASANLFVEGSVRSPIFYDRDDTTFYTDPNGHSRIRTITRSQDRFSSGSWYPLGHYATGETVFEIDPTWTTTELRAYFNSSAVDWVADSTAPGGYAISIVGAINVGGAYSSGFPFIPVEQDDIFYMECWIKDVSGTNGHYMGSIDYNQSFSSLGGNPGSFGYWAMLSTFPGTSWTKISGYVGGFATAGSGAGTFVTGTKYWTPQALFNYSGGGTSYISGWKVTKVNKRSRLLVQAVGGGNSSSAYHIAIKADISNSANPDLTLSTDSSYSYIQSWNSKPLILNDAGNIVYAGDFRPTIVYDRNNTGYYADPASTSLFNATRHNDIVAGTTAGLSSMGQIGVYSGGSPYISFHSGTTSRTAYFQEASGRFYCGEVDYTESEGSFRSPLFYDVNNTGYYGDFASTSRMNNVQATKLTRSDHAEGFLEGSYNNVGSNDSKTNPIYTIGSSYNPTSTSLSNMYGIGYSHPNFWSGKGGGWGLYVASNGSIKGTFGCESDPNTWISGYGISTSSWRAPYFYDSDNTAYFIDAAANSELNRINTVRTNNWLYIDSNYGHSVVGVYASTRLQGVFAMGDSYKLSADGTSAGTLYGIAWSHPNAGGVASNLASHGMLILENGGFRGAWGGGRLVTTADIRGTIFYDYDNTNYYIEPTSTTSLRTVGSWRADSSSWDGEFSGKIQYHSSNWYFQSGSLWIFRNAGGSNIFTCNQSGTVEASADFRAPYFYDSNNTAYYTDPASTSNINAMTTAGTARVYNLKFIGEGGNSGNGTESYAIFQEGGAWSNPYPDLRIAFHTGIKFGANPSYEGMRFYTDYDMSSLILQVNGSSNYIYKYTWMYTTTAGFYSDTNGAHFKPNDSSSYGGWHVQGTRNGWRGIHFYDGGSAPHLMFDGSSNGGIYYETGGRWAQYYHYGNVCQSINTSSSSSSYGLYVSGSIYSTGNITAYSDARKKENVVTVDNALDKVNKLRGVFYNKIDDEKKTKQIGVIAQEVKEVLPEVVTHAEDVDEYGVTYGNFAGLFIEAFKEQTKIINDLKQKIEELETKLEKK